MLVATLEPKTRKRTFTTRVTHTPTTIEPGKSKTLELPQSGNPRSLFMQYLTHTEFQKSARLNNLTNPELLLFDERMSAANTIKRYLQTLDPADRNILESFVTSDEFAREFLSGHVKTLVNNIPEDTEENKRVKELLKELLIHVHVETGVDYYEVLPEHDQYSHCTQFPDPALLECEREFIKIIKSKDKTYNWSSLFEGTVPDMAIMTHNRDRVLDTVRKYADNLLSFGHRGVRIHVFDDSNDKGRIKRKAEVLKIADEYKDKGIEIIYFGKEERELKLEEYEKQILKSPDVQSLVEMGFSVKDLIASALGMNGGIGANRNWAMLELGDKNFAMIDDDVMPFARVESPGKTKDIPVDILSITSRGLNRPLTTAVTFNYIGYQDSQAMAALTSYFSDSEQKNPIVESPTNYEVLSAVYCSARSNSTQGGILAIAGMNYGSLARVPAPTKSDNYLRVEDLLIGNLQTMLSKFINGWEVEIVYTPSAGVSHEREVQGRPEGAVSTVINENIGSSVFWESQSNLFAEVTDTIDISNQNALNKKEQVLKTFVLFGEKIHQFINSENFNLSELTTCKQSVKDLIEFCILEKSVTDLIELYYKNIDTKAPNRAKVLEELKSVLEKFGCRKCFDYKDFDEYKKSPDYEKLDLQPVLEILKPELKAYADTLMIWPHLLAAHSEIKKESSSHP